MNLSHSNLSITVFLILFTLVSHHLTIEVSALNFNLSSLWDFLGFSYDDLSSSYEDARKKLLFPRRDLVHDLGGKEHYQKLVKHALGANSSNGKEEVNKERDKSQGNSNDDNKLVYGVDVSFPMQYLTDASNSNHEYENENIANLKKQQDELYQDYIAGCNEYYLSGGKKSSTSGKEDAGTSPLSPSSLPCNKAEQDRFDMNVNQPPIMQNYTMLGFQKTKIPKTLFRELQTFWNNHNVKQKKEAWGRMKQEPQVDSQQQQQITATSIAADTHVNHWASPTYMVHIDNPYFEGGGMELKNYIWHVARLKLEEWINTGGGSNFSSQTATARNNKQDGAAWKNLNDDTKWTLSPTSIYGIRVYKSGSILAPHVDRLPLVTSAIINVDQDVDQDWPLEVIGHDGVAYNITMEPGDMLLYESHSVIHGRPYPLKGRFYANIFVHFEPSGHCMRHSDRMQGQDVKIDDAKALYERAQRRVAEEKKREPTVKVKSEIERLQDRFKFNFENGELKQVIVDKDNQDQEDDDSESVPAAPSFISPDSVEEKRWKQKINYDMDSNDLKAEVIDTHKIAGTGKLADMMYAYQLSPLSIIKRDENGWQPIHEAARAGHLNIVKYLVEQGSSVHSRTGRGGTGGSVLWWALKFHDEDHPVVVYLLEKGAKSEAPESVKSVKVAKTSKSKAEDDDQDDDDDNDGEL